MTAEPAKRPNFLIARISSCGTKSLAFVYQDADTVVFGRQIVADDLGFSDIGAFGSEVSLPSISAFNVPVN